MAKPTASLSLDLDNLWSYLKTHGEPEWEQFPTYLPRLIPRVLAWLRRHNQRITFFVVGQDAALKYNAEGLSQLARAGHEVGNHSFHHEPWMKSEPVDKLTGELARAEDAIAAVTGHKPIGFRGPGFCQSAALLEALARLGYQYDASMLPSLVGPLARRYYLWSARLDATERRRRAELFGKLSDGLAPLRPFLWTTPAGEILEIPVSTVPLLRLPFHFSYILWLSGFSRTLARGYLRLALGLCRARGIEPSFLLHPLDFLGPEDAPELAFFPGMQLSGEQKMELAEEFIGLYQRWFEVVPLGEQMRLTLARGSVNRRVAATPEVLVPSNVGAARE